MEQTISFNSKWLSLLQIDNTISTPFSSLVDRAYIHMLVLCGHHCILKVLIQFCSPKSADFITFCYNVRTTSSVIPSQPN